jgi:hypothetical protein
MDTSLGSTEPLEMPQLIGTLPPADCNCARQAELVVACKEFGDRRNDHRHR